MAHTTPWRRLCAAGVLALIACGTDAAAGLGQSSHPHTPSVSGMPQGVPFFCANPTATTAASGRWSDPRTWSSRRVPGANDKVAIGADHQVTYDTVNDSKLECIEVRGHLTFAPDKNTRMKVGTLMVLEEGHLEVGNSARPVAPHVTAELVIADQPIDTAVDPGQLGTGIIGAGKVTMHGAVKAPTFVRLRREPLAGDATIELEQPVEGWTAGNHVVIPDSRQLRTSERGRSYVPHTEKRQIASVSGSRITLAAPLAYTHPGARTGDGALAFLPHIANLSRNVIVRSENPHGTRGHTVFISRADVDLRYVEFRELGRTRMGAVDNTQFDTDGRALKIGRNQIGRYAVHFHHNFGPRTPPANGHQFTVIGIGVDGASKWGITVHRSHYGLIRDNVVHNTRDAGIVTEDGSESFNVFDHNFSVQSAGRSELASGVGYGSAIQEAAGEGAGFWFRGPNNYIRNNVAASGRNFGFGLQAAALGTVRVPAFKGADTSRAAESVQFDTTNAPVLEFANNEAYGTMQTGLACVWNGAISNFTAWHASHQSLAGSPPDKLTVDKLTVRGDASVLGDVSEKPVGVWISNYISKSVTIRRADVQGMRVGILSPFFYDQTPEPGRGAGSLVIEQGYFRNHVGISVATAYTANSTGGVRLKNAVVRSSAFEPLNVQGANIWPPESISMNYEMSPRDPQPRDPILVYDYNKQPGNDFRVYYSYQAPEATSPCHNALPGVGGWVCK